ncbi:M48 family metalloprotease [Parachitinimonas caeni]|uniref:M48 family metalloprotease n=1 Tax=Parachitinimonas caeni TaxID=3031301 RepID=A0ABT7DSK1_9NEIS|nr:M48 family metalloprotease [Parachitinimonas caeni]MDK2123046.1 M48 family metalloprotease [Parachitinimonas caeni]
MNGIFKLTLASSVLALAACANVNVNQVNQGLTALQKMSQAKSNDPAVDLTLGMDFSARLLGAAKLDRDLAMQRYVNQVGTWVALQSDQPKLHWRFGVLDAPQINAFSGPGGYIFITRGLYQTLRNESELACVLGHEIAHVTQRHHASAKANEGLYELGALALDAAASNYSRNSGSLDANQRAEMSKNMIKGFVGEWALRGFDRKQEFEADRIGVVLCARAGYNPFGLIGTLQTLQQYRREDGPVSWMFSTHPSLDDRLRELDAAMGDKLDAYTKTSESGNFSRFKR